MGCLDENTLVALVDGTLAHDARSGSVRHLDVCSSCRAAVGSLVRLAHETSSHDAALAPTVASERPPARSTFSPGDVLAQRYHLERVVGEGGLGVVWAATHAITRKPVALKILKVTHPELNKRFLREARVAGALRHPNVVDVHDVFAVEPDGPLVMVMDLLEGQSLDRLLDSRGPLTPGETLRLLHPVWNALVSAHALGIVHRDLKPQNIFIARFGQETRPMLLDFGLAKLTASEGAAAMTTALTRDKTVMGTPTYMAPEQLYGETNLDLRTDIWAVGAVLFECMSGRRPLEGVTVGQIMKSLATREIPPLASVVPGAPAELAAAVDQMLRRDRDERPASLAPFLELSERLLAHGVA